MLPWNARVLGVNKPPTSVGFFKKTDPSYRVLCVPEPWQYQYMDAVAPM